MRTYLFSIVAICLGVSLLSMLPQKNSIRRIVTLCGGICLFLVLVRPLLALRFDDLGDWFSKYQADEDMISGAIEDGQNEAAALITRQTEEYILDKAQELGFSVEAEVTLSALSEHYQYPYRATVTGSWTATQRRDLSEYMAQTLGIPEERQIWNEKQS